MKRAMTRTLTAKVVRGRVHVAAERLSAPTRSRRREMNGLGRPRD
jgi:hypothetical protein